MATSDYALTSSLAARAQLAVGAGMVTRTRTEDDLTEEAWGLIVRPEVGIAYRLGAGLPLEAALTAGPTSSSTISTGR